MPKIDSANLVKPQRIWMQGFNDAVFEDVFGQAYVTIEELHKKHYLGDEFKSVETPPLCNLSNSYMSDYFEQRSFGLHSYTSGYKAASYILLKDQGVISQVAETGGSRV
ncbi:MAG TPA: hypothetical protein VLF90_03335 [Patescibacteria group bacterium]|nr:hypothetical protein [Patescibacteria group bacterium]